MHKLISLIVVLSGLYGGYWFVGANRLEAGLKEYLAAEHGPDDIIQIDYANLAVRGFPNRFDTRFEEVSIENKTNGILYSAPFFQIYALSYKPYHIIASLPHSQSLRLAGEQLGITSDEIKGSVVFDAPSLLDKALEIDRSSFVMSNLMVTSDQGWNTSIKTGSVAVRQTPTKPLHYDLAISAQNISLPRQLRMLVDPAGKLSELFDSIQLDSTLAFNNPLNLLADNNNQPVLEDIKVTDLTFIWDDIQFQAKGALTIDSRGYPNGKLDLTATNWQKIYQLAQDSGAVDPEFAPTVQNGLRVLAGMSESGEIIKASLNFTDGQMSIGPFAIGPAPRLR